MIDFLIKLGVSSQYAGDVVLLIFFLILSLVFALFLKKEFLGALLFAIYLAYLITLKTPFDFLENANLKLIYFGLLIILLFFLLRRFLVLKFNGGVFLSLFKSVLLSFFAIAFLSSVLLQWLPVSSVEEYISFSSWQYLLSAEAQFFWMIVPLLTMLIFKFRQ